MAVPTLAFGTASALAQSAPLGLRDTVIQVANPNIGATSTLDSSTGKSVATRRKTNQRSGRPFRHRNQLPPLTAFPGAERSGLRGGASPLDSMPAPPPTIAVIPSIDPKRRPRIDEKPFDPTGVSFGGLRLKPYLEEDLGYASNPSSVPSGAKGSAYENTEAGLAFQSDWARDEIRGAVRGGYANYFANSSANAPYGSGLVAGRFDVSRSVFLDAETHFSVFTQTLGSLTLPYGAVLSSGGRPLVDTFGGSAGGTAIFGDLALSLHGTFERTAYGNATLSNGVVDDLSSDASSDWGLRGRIAYHLSPLVAPFVEFDADRRIYDAGEDASGFFRDSIGGSAIAGISLAWTNQLAGEISAGYGNRTYKDPRLPDLHAPLVNGLLTWFATPLTTISLKAGTNLADTTTPGASGAVSNTYTIGISHALFRNLTLSAAAGYATDTYSGVPIRDETTTLGLGAEYSLSRELLLRSTLTRTQYTSNVPNSSYIANIFMLGLRVQR